MSVERIDALMMKKCFLAGAKALEARKDYINDSPRLFRPVPCVEPEVTPVLFFPRSSVVLLRS